MNELLREITPTNDWIIDLHMHSTNSDGTLTTSKLMEKLVEKKANLISFTDHDSVGCYADMEKLIKAGNNDYPLIVSGVELSFCLRGALRDVLGYGFDVKQMDEWLQNRYSLEQRIKKQQALLKRFKEVCRSLELRFNEDVEVVNGTKSEAFVVLYHSLNKYSENLVAYPFIADNTQFYRKYFSNPDTSFFVDETVGLPSRRECIDAIHDAGGLAFLAHPRAYGFSESDASAFLNEALGDGIDGVEVWHSSNQGNDVGILQKFADKHHLYVSGGSDFHGSTKPGLELIKGYGNMRVPGSALLPWIGKRAWKPV